MTPRLSGHYISIFGLVFFVLWSLLRIARQWSYEKFAILSMKPNWSHFGILTYRMWSINDITGVTRDVVLHWHLPECWVANVLRQKFHLVASFLKNLSVTCLLICKLRYTCSHFDLQNWFLLSHEPFLAGLMLERNTPGPWKNDRCSTCDNEHWVFLVIQHMIVYILVWCEWTTMRLT